MWAALADADLVAGVFDFGALDGSPSPLRVPAATRQLGFLPFGLSANLAVRREVFEAVHGFDEDLSPGEDVDLCWRLQLAGFRFAVATDAVVEKRERAAGLPTFRGAWAYGRCGPALYVRYRGRGHAARPAGSGKGVGLVGGHSSRPRRCVRRRRQWVRTFGMRSGRLAGSDSDAPVFFPLIRLCSRRHEDLVVSRRTAPSVPPEAVNRRPKSCRHAAASPP